VENEKSHVPWYHIFKWNTLCKTCKHKWRSEYNEHNLQNKKTKNQKKKSLLFNSNRIWIPHSKRVTHLLILTVKSEINGRPLASCYRISHDKYLFFTLNMYCYMYIYKRYLIFKVINNLFNRAWIRYLVQRFPKIWWKKIIEILSSHESSQCTNK